MLNPTKLNQYTLSEYEYNLYSRQIIMEKFGINGQKRIKAAKVLCIGAGGLNSSALLYLSSAGIGTIGIIDNDNIESSNLQRQIIYKKQDIKKAKVTAAKSAINSLNPLCKIDIFQIRLNDYNISELLINYDIVIDGTDNIESRYIISKACQNLHKIHIYGAVENLKGQISVFNYQGGPHYEILYPNNKNYTVNSCNKQGILGPLPGIIGLLQTVEALKIITGIGKVLNGELLIYNLTETSFKKVKIRRQKIQQKSLCNLRKTQTTNEKIDTKKFISQITLKKFQSAYQTVILDIRESLEFKLHHLKDSNSINIPLKNINKKSIISHLKSLSKKKVIVIYCNNNIRSAIASEILTTHTIKHYILINSI